MKQINNTQRVDIDITVDHTNAYSIGDVIGGLVAGEGSLLYAQVDSAISGKSSGTICDIFMTDAAALNDALTLYIFDEYPTTEIDDDAAFAPVIADLNKCIARIVITAGEWVTVNSLGYLKLPDEYIRYNVQDGKGKLWFYLVAGEASDWTAATDLHMWMELYTD